MNTKRKKLRKDRLAILLVICAVVITTVGFGIWKITSMLFTDPYEEYKAYQTKGKDYGDIQQVSKEYENEAFVSFTYPAYKEKNLNTIVKAYEKKAVTAASKAEKQITSIDYDSSLLFDRYVNRATPFCRLRFVTTTGAPFTRFCVYAPAAEQGVAL